MDALPPKHAEICIVQAATHYGAHPDLIRAIAKVEGGKPGQIVWNKNGSYDMGRMQINSIHLLELAKYGITREMLIHDDCLNIHIGTYLLQRNIIKSSDFWTGVGAYHSRTPDLNYRYKHKVYQQVQRLHHVRERSQ